jgi:hypothetical protein
MKTSAQTHPSVDQQAAPAAPADLHPLSPSASTNATTFTKLDLYPNIETVGIVLSGANLPNTAELSYRRSADTAW